MLMDHFDPHSSVDSVKKAVHVFFFLTSIYSGFSHKNIHGPANHHDLGNAPARRIDASWLEPKTIQRWIRQAVSHPPRVN